MKTSTFLKDNAMSFFLFILSLLFTMPLLFLFKLPKAIIILITLTLLIFYIVDKIIYFYKRKTFYNTYLNTLNELDQKYLIGEMIHKPDFLEGKILYDSIYDINKSMIEKIKQNTNYLNEFKEYIEMWIHEVKLPLSSIQLMVHSDKREEQIKEQLLRIDNDVEQVLFYSRSEYAEKDFKISTVSLNKIMSTIAIKNKNIFLKRKIDLRTDGLDGEVLTDSKWLSFILNQIISNSLKYYDEKKDSFIEVSLEQENGLSKLTIYDNGIGIKKEDLSSVFEKTFTGSNGRERSASTGMGLYIAKRLCEKLGHKIEIESIFTEYTKVTITFQQDDYFNVT
ncbi:MAG: sensor histidine kinase [Bacilli bacterium]|nr:sensor histidine kinase [Bacilli bacterium]